MGRLSRVDWTETSWCWVVFLGDPGRWVELVVCSAQNVVNDHVGDVKTLNEYVIIGFFQEGIEHLYVLRVQCNTK